MKNKKLDKDYYVGKVISSTTLIISLIVSLLSASIISGANTLLSSSFIFLYGILIILCLGCLAYVIWEIDKDNKLNKIKKKVFKTRNSENIFYNIVVILLSIEFTFMVITLLTTVAG